MDIKKFIRQVRIESRAKAEAREMFAPPLRLVAIVIALTLCLIALEVIDLWNKAHPTELDRLALQILIEDNQQ